MQVHAGQDKNTSKSAAENHGKKISSTGIVAVDNRSEAIMQRKLQAMADVHSMSSVPPLQLIARDEYRNQLDRNNVIDNILLAIRADIDNLDWGGWWRHIEDNHHNANPPVKDKTTFMGDTQDNIKGYTVNAIMTTHPDLSVGGVLVFETNAGNICNGNDGLGNIRVMIDVNDVDDSVPMAQQLGSMRVRNSYPIA
jgi:hypothetical protein